jgi:hypothetical protein
MAAAMAGFSHVISNVRGREPEAMTRTTGIGSYQPGTELRLVAGARM